MHHSPLLAFAMALAFCFPTFARTPGRVLVILSSSDKITLKDGIIHPTGFFLTELMGPVKELHDRGYELVFANPNGSRPVMDKVSDSAFWFGDVPGASGATRKTAQREYAEARQLCERLSLCGPQGTLTGTTEVRDLPSIVNEGLDAYDGVFFPGGHAPMEDLWKDPSVRTVLRYFHAHQKPTALICHAPIALLAALDDPEAYISAKIRDDRAAMVAASRNWIYRGYTMTVFTTREEQQEEPGADNALGGFVRFYADESLEKAGGYVVRADKWQSNVVVSHELVTGQNPFSHGALATTFVKLLEQRH